MSSACLFLTRTLRTALKPSFISGRSFCTIRSDSGENGGHRIDTGYGTVQLVLGPMFSGKTTELLRRVRRFQYAQRNCLMVKYSHDTRYSETDGATHDLQTFKATSCSSLQDISDEYDDYDVIGVDEGQFFADLVPFCEEATEKGKTVIVAALDGTFERKPFGSILDLVPKAESVTKLTAVCAVCFKDAAFTKRLSDSKELEVIGGSELYMPVCRGCFHAPQSSQLS